MSHEESNNVVTFAALIVERMLSLRRQYSRCGTIRDSKNSARKSSRDRTVAMIRAGTFPHLRVLFLWPALVRRAGSRRERNRICDGLQPLT
jgi:hypothetical protein